MISKTQSVLPPMKCNQGKVEEEEDDRVYVWKSRASFLFLGGEKELIGLFFFFNWILIFFFNIVDVENVRALNPTWQALMKSNKSKKKKKKG